MLRIEQMSNRNVLLQPQHMLVREVDLLHFHRAGKDNFSLQNL